MTDWAKLKVVDLKAELKRRDLAQHGLKAELVARLTAADDEAASAPAAESGQEAPQDEASGGDKTADQQTPAEPEPADAIQAEGTQRPVVGERRDEAVANVEDHAPMATYDTAAQEAPKDVKEPGPQDAKNSEPPELSETHDTPVVSVPELEEKPTPQEEAQTKTDDMMMVDSTQDSQKRKRRSASPPPDKAGVAKRARTVDEPPTSDQPESSKPADTVDSRDKNEDPDNAPPVRSSLPRGSSQPPEDAMDQRTVAPSVHPATPALYIANLMRPLRPIDIQTHLIDLATPPRVTLSDDILVQFYLDQIRTHAFVVFASTAAASRVRTLLHDCVWPNESNRKALWVDFIPPEKVQAWIDTESGGAGGRTGNRWEIVYSDGPDGAVEANLESATGSLSRAPPPPTSAPPGRPRFTGHDSANDIPLGPRGASDRPPPPSAPTGPRAKRSGPGPVPSGKRTHAHPVIFYSPVPEELARRRLANMRSFSSPRRGGFGREINRYSFEDGDSFVDRGKEVFEGIRPPHRERAMRGGGGGGRGGFGGGRPPRRPRPRSDRYLPGGGDRPPRDGRW